MSKPMAAVEDFYFYLRGSTPTLNESWEYMEEEYFEVIRELECSDIEGFRERLAKELADLMFTVYGVALAADIDLDAAFGLVAESNMTKAPATMESMGKIQKGPNYVAPDMTWSLL